MLLLEAVGQIFECDAQFFVPTGGWKSKVVREKLDGIGDLVSFGGRIIALVISVMVGSWAYIVARGSSVSPC